MSSSHAGRTTALQAETGLRHAARLGLLLSGAATTLAFALHFTGLATASALTLLIPAIPTAATGLIVLYAERASARAGEVGQ